MEQSTVFRTLIRMALLALIGFFAVLIVVVPITPGVLGIPMPDLLICVCAYWVLRRPASASMVLIFALGVFADVMQARPLGVGALSLVLMVEVLRAQRHPIRDLGIVMEWVIVSVLITLAILLQYSLLWLTLGALPDIGVLAQYAAATCLSYPVTGLFLRLIVGLKHRGSHHMAYSEYMGGR